MDERLRRGFRIGAFSVEPLTGRITGPDGSQHVQPKVMDVLVYLAQHAGQLVERDTLLEQVWRRVTSEEVLTRCISELRRTLGDDRGSPGYIQTVPKRGYRLIEPVVLADAVPYGPTPSPSPPPPQQPIDMPGPPSPDTAVGSVAVLPFDNHSVIPAYQFLGDAFAAELHSTLARTDRLRVASRRSSFVFKDNPLDVREIGSRLDVEYVISGSLQCSESHLHIVAELNDARKGTQLWARSYDRKSDDVLAVEREIAEAIVGAFTTQQLRIEIQNARGRSTDSLDAWGLVQKARAYALDYTAANLTAAIAPLKRAIELDNDYAAAHATLGSLLVEGLVNGLSRDSAADETAALAAADKALTLAPQDPFILKMVSLVFSYGGDQRKALQCLRKAVHYAPFDFGAWGYMGWPLTASDDVDQLTELKNILERLLALEPQHPGVAFWHYHHSVADVCEGRFDPALESAEAAVELRPNFALAWIHCASVLGQLQANERAKQALERCLRINPAMTPKHFEQLVRRFSSDEQLAERRLGGLRRIGALRR